MKQLSRILLLAYLMVIPVFLTFAQETLPFTEDFSENVMPPTGWTTDVGTGSLQMSDGTHAGGEAPQGYINGWPQAVGTTRLISPVIDVSSYTTLELELKYAVNSAAYGNFSLKVETTSDGGTTWNEVWSVTPAAAVWASTETIAITNADLGSENFQFAYTYEATAVQAIYHAYFDDFSLTGTQDVLYDITFSVDDTEGNPIEGANIALSNTTAQTTDATGQAIFSNVAPGTYTYDLTASGFTPETGSITVEDANLAVDLAMEVMTSEPAALDFDGTDEYVQTGYSGVLGASPRTVMAWIYLNSNTTANNCITDYGSGSTQGARNTFMVSASKKLSFLSGISTGNFSSPNEGDIPVEEWVHVAFVFDGTTGYLYKNGVELISAALPGINTINSGVDVLIGERVPGGSINFSGMIDEVSFWDVALSAQEVSDNACIGDPSQFAGLAAYYNFNQGTGIALTDLVGGNDGVLMNMEEEDWVSSSTCESSTYAVTFTVEDTDGNPIEGAEIAFDGAAALTTDALGQVIISDLDPETYTYDISATGFIDQTGSVIVSDANVELDITMVEAEAVTYTLPFTEDFTDGTCPAEDWAVTPEGTTNWIINDANYAGGVAPEGKFYGWPQFTGTTRLISPVITTSGETSLQLAFKHKCQGAVNTDYSFKIETTSDGGTTWNEVFSVTPNGSWPSPIEEAITIENGDVGSENFQFCLSYVSTNLNGAYHYNFDDFSLTANQTTVEYTLPFTEDFTDGACPAEDWAVTPEGTTNWIINDANYAGGVAPEGKFYGWPQFTGTTRLISPVITTAGETSLELAFKHKCQGAVNTDYSFKIETTSDGGTTWNEVFSVTPNGSWPSPIEEVISIENGDVGSENFQFCLSYVSTNLNGAYHYNFDDFSLTAVEAPSGLPLPFTEDFSENVMPPTDWNIEAGPGLLQTNDGTHAGGTAPQGYIYGWPQSVGTTRLISPVIDASSTASLDLEFKYAVNSATYGNFSLKIETTSDGGATWNEVWSVSPTAYTPGTTEEVTITNADVGSNNFQFAYTYETTAAQAIYHAYFDDFELKETAESTYAVTFTVEDTDGNPIEGAEVAFEDAGTLTTDALGQVVIEEIEPGDYTYDVTANDFVAESGSLTVSNADVEETVVLSALQYYTATFNVSDGTNPIEGASVNINEQVLTTDASGIATIDLADGDYPYTVTIDGYTDGTGVITVAAAAVEEFVELEMMQYYAATFTVTDGTSPIAGATVIIGDVQITTNASGQAIFDELIEGYFTYGVFAVGYTAEQGSNTIVDQDLSIDITMGEATQYTLPFTEDFAVSMPPADWWLTENGGDSWGLENSISAGGVAPEGYFTCYLEGIVLGTTRLVTPEINTVGETTLTLDFKHKLQGRTNTNYSLSIETTSDGGATWNEVWSITPAGNVAAEALTIVIENSDVGSEHFQYCLKYISTTNYGAMQWWFDDFSLIGVQGYNLTFNVDDEAGDPIDGATVSINNVDLTTDVDGVASIMLLNGDYDYTVIKDGYFDGTGTITMADADMEESVTLAVWVGQDLTFTVTDGTDPLEGAIVNIDGQDLSTDVDGVASVVLAAGDYPYTVSKDEYYDNSGTITVADASVEETVVLDFIYYYDVAFTVTDGSSPIEGASVNINAEVLTTDASGMATITLPNGDYPYSVQLDGYAQHTGTAIVADADVNINSVLSQADVLFVERFDEGIMPPAGWDITPTGTGNWIISETTYAGGDSPEGKYYYFPFFQGITRLMTPVINTSAYGALELNFSHNLTTAEVAETYSIRLQTTSDGGTTWNEVWSIIPGGSFPLTNEVITIDNEDVGSPNFQFCLAYQSSEDRGVWHYYFDDFVLTGVSSGEDVYSVTYNVKDEAQNPIEGAQVTMGNYGTFLTNADGQVMYTDVALGNYAWTVNAGSGFVAQTGTANVADADLVFDLEMEAIEPVFPFSEYFTDNTITPEGWTIVGGGNDNWITSNTINAGGTAPEAAFANTPAFDGTSRLVSPVLNSAGIMSLMLDFKQFVDDNAGSAYSLKVETTSDGGTTWNEIWSVSPTGDIAQENVQVLIENADVGSENFQFAFTFEGNTTQINSWYFDDIYMEVVQLADLIHEEFTTGEAFPPEGWDFIGGGSANWGKSATDNAGGEASEIYFAWGPPYFEGTSRFVTPMMSTYAYSTLKLEFNQFVWVNGTQNYAYKVETSGDGGATWNEIWSITPQEDVQSELVQLLIDNEDVGSDNFLLSFTFEGNSNQINYWYVDNIFLTDGAGAEVYPVTFAANDVDGNPLEDVLINLGSYGEKLTDASGEVTYENVFTGDYSYYAAKYRYTTQIADVVVADEAVTVELEMTESLDLLSEEFGGAFPPLGWDIVGDGQGNWSRSVMSAYAGGEAPECVFYTTGTSGFIGNSKLVSPVINTSDFTALFFDFKQYVADIGGSDYNLMVETTSDGGTTWNEVWSISPTGNINPETVSFLIQNTDVGSENFQIAMTFDGSSVQLEKWYVDDILLYGALAYDAGVKSIDNTELAVSGTILDPTATVKNLGFETVSFDVTFEINDGATVYSETQTVTNMAPLAEQSVTFPEWTAIAGAYDVIVSVDLVGDENADNDVLSQGLDVASGLVPLQQLYEVFTSSTCGPCVAGNAAIDGVLEDNPGEYSLIKYQVNFPGYGDPYYTAEVGERVSYYEVSYAPDLYINADQNSATGLTQGIFDQYQTAETALEINVTEAIIGEDNMITVSADLTSIINYAEGLTAHIVVVEKLTTGNVGSNGETEFHNVMMKMLPDASGTTLAALTTGTPVTITESYDMSLTNMETSDDLAVIIIVQDDTDKSLIQTTMVDVIGSQGNDVGITAINSPNSGENLSNAETVTISLKNFGSGTQTDINWEVTWTGPNAGSLSGVYAGPVASAETVSFDAGTADLSAEGEYIFTACTILAGDENSSNDCTEKMVEHEEMVTIFDVGISAIESPNSSVDLSDSEMVTLSIDNFGTETVTDVDWEVTWEGPNAGSLSGVFAGPLAADESVSFDAGTVDLSVEGTYEFTACTFLVDDADASNDCTEKTVIHTITPPEEMLSLYYEGEAFESGETVIMEDWASLPEIVCEMAIQNDYTVAKDILVSKEIISEATGHTNTFCWGACFPNNTIISPSPITLEPGVLNDEDFSGHLMPNGFEGTTTIKYTFFEENNPTVEVHFFVEYTAIINPDEVLSLYYEGEAFEAGETVTMTGDANLPEIVCEMAIQNDYTEAKSILVSKEIISEATGHTNTFCWGACFPNNVFISPSPITLEPGVLNDEDFSGHLMPNGFEGTSIIKYTFFEENNPNVEVHFFVEYIATIESPEISVTPMDISFGEVLVGNTLEELITITNQGTVSLEVSDITSNDAAFYVNVSTLSIEPGNSEDVIITFEPSEAILYEAEISIQSNDPNNATVVVEVSGEGKPIGTNQLSEQGFVIYPNPATDKFFIEITADVEKVQLLSLEGKIILEETFVGNKLEINTTNYYPGMYFIKLISNDKEIIRKVIIN